MTNAFAANTRFVQFCDENGLGYGVKHTENVPHVHPVDGTGNPVGVQYPLEVDGDSVYAKDIDLTYSSNGDFVAVEATGATGSVTDYFNSLISINVNSTADNPKSILVWFYRSVYSHAIGIGCNDITSGGFGTDVTVKLLGSGQAVRYTKNFTGINPHSALLEFGPKAFNGFILEFNTADVVCLSNITIRRAVEGIVTLQAIKPDGTVTTIDATAGGNLKVAIEEFDDAVSVNSNTQLKTTLFRSNGLELNIDPTTGAVCTTDYPHCEIHEGSHFFNKSETDLGNGATFDILLVTPNTTKWAHNVFYLNTEAEIYMVLYEGTTTSSNGTALTVVNRNRNSATANTTLLFHTPTVTSVGTAIATYKGGSGAKVGSEIRSNAEMIKKQNTKYLFRITNSTALNNWIDWIFDWYEHTNS